MMDFSGAMHSKIAGVPAPVVVLAGGGILGLYLRSRNKAKASTTGTPDPAAVSQYGSLPTAVDPNSGAVYAIDPATGRSFQLPWNGGAGSVPIGINNGVNTPTTPSTPTTMTPGTTIQPIPSTNMQPPPIGNVVDHQGTVLTSNPIGSYPDMSNPPTIVGTPVPVGISPVQAIQAGYSAPQADYGQLAPIPQSPTQQPNYQGSLYMVGGYPMIAG
jgi:hypothetical protein